MICIYDQDVEYTEQQIQDWFKRKKKRQNNPLARKRKKNGPQPISLDERLKYEHQRGQQATQQQALSSFKRQYLSDKPELVAQKGVRAGADAASE